MEFGIFSNGFRPHTSASKTYEEDIYEIVLADRLGFTDAYISEHHGEPPYINKVDTIPVPELIMCKAAGLTKQIKMGAAVKLIHLQHPFDVAIQAAATDHVVGNGRFIFGFGSGFPNPLFSRERGLDHEERYGRLAESLEFILKCWTTEEPFDWDGEYWKAKGVVALPKPFSAPHMPMATATEQEPMLKLAAERGYTLLSAFLEPVESLRKKSQRYADFAKAAGHVSPRRKISAARVVHIADSVDQAKEEVRAGIAYETSVQAERGLLQMLKKLFGLEIPNDSTAIDAYVESGFYMLGDCDRVTEQLTKFYEQSGGFGSLLIVTGKDWATRDARTRSMTLFMEQVAPRLRHLNP